MQRVVIVGGGFAGLAVARALRGVADVFVIDPKPAHTYTPWLYEVASGVCGGPAACRARGAAADVRFTEMRGYEHVTFVQDAVADVRTVEKVVLTAQGQSYRYDALVLAVGSVPNDFGLPGVKEYARFLKTSEQASAISREFGLLLKKGVGRVVLVGAGPTGVETAAEMALVARRAGGGVQVALLDGGALPLGVGAHPRVGRVALRRLQRVGVRYVGEARLARMDGATVTYTVGERSVTEGADLVVWCGGVKANPVVQRWRLPLDEKGRVRVTKNFSVVDVPNVYALGDVATVVNPHTGRPDPQSAQVALRQAAHFGWALARALRFGGAPAPFPFSRHWELVVAVGGRYAVGDVFGVRGGGYLFFLLRHLIDLRYFLAAFSWRQAWTLYRRGTMVL